MSFLIDPPLLILSGVAIYIVGRRLDWNRQSKIVVGLGIALIFIIFSSLLYADLIRCTIPFFSGMKGSEFMFHSNLTGIYKTQVPLFMIAIFSFYTLFGYMLATLPSFLFKSAGGSLERFILLVMCVAMIGMALSALQWPETRNRAWLQGKLWMPLGAGIGLLIRVTEC